MDTREPDSPDNGDSSTDEHHGEAGQSIGETPVVVNVNQSVTNPEKTQEQSAKKHRDGYDRAHIWLLGFTFAAALAAAIFTGILALSTSDLVGLSDVTAKREMRSYVNVRGGNVYNASVQKQPQPRIIITNSGRTFARNVQIWAGTHIGPPLSPSEQAALGPGNRKPGTLVLGPDIPYIIIERGRVIETTELDQVNPYMDKTRIYVFGRVDYEDIFDGTHWIEFCFVYHGEMDNFPRNGGPGFNSTQAQACDAGNDVDTD